MTIAHKPVLDTNGDGDSDILLGNNATGGMQLLEMSGLNYTAYENFEWGLDWTLRTFKLDLNGDGKSDIVAQQQSTGTLQLLLMDGLNYTTKNYAWGTD